MNFPLSRQFYNGDLLGLDCTMIGSGSAISKLESLQYLEQKDRQVVFL